MATQITAGCEAYHGPYEAYVLEICTGQLAGVARVRLPGGTACVALAELVHAADVPHDCPPRVDMSRAMAHEIPAP